MLAALLTLTPAAAMAQGVIVAPHAVFIDHATRSGSITLYNPGENPVEVTVSFGFGYPTTDSAGSIERGGLRLRAGGRARRPPPGCRPSRAG